MATLKSVFDKHFGHLEFDAKLAKKIYNYQIEYLNSNREYLDFYSTNLLGVHRLRFKASDFDKFMYEVLEVDAEELDRDLDDVPVVMKINSVTSDVLNISCVYLIHMFMHSNSLNEKERYRACYDVSSIFFMRSFAALISDYFRYPAEERIVKIAYSNLSGNNLIKKLGNWLKVVDYRVHALLEKNGIHYKTLKGFLEDKVAYVISDSKDRIKDIIKNYYREIVKVRDSGDILGTIGSLAENMEGEIGLVDRIDAVANDTMKIKTLITNNNFINEDIVYLIWTMNRNTTPKSIKDVLKWVCDNYISDTNNELVNNFIEECVKYTYFLLRNKIHNAKNKDISAIINELKNLYLSTRNEDSDLLLLRDLGGKIINKAKGKNISKSLYLSSRTALILYISLMTLTA
jgi:hypothetical protein